MIYTDHMLGIENIWRGVVDLVLIILPNRNHQGNHGLLVEVFLSRRLNTPLHHRITGGEGCFHIPNVKGGDRGILIHLGVGVVGGGFLRNSMSGISLTSM